ncbi:MAG TPA: hypothetical protein VGM44_14910, partial [Polyangiaceae bacterium]
MSFAAIPAEVDGFGSGEVSLVGPEVLRELLRAADEEGYLSVVLNPPGPGQRGELALFISEAIDDALQQRGACPPGVGAATDLGAALSDQLYRARLIELRGLTLALPTLEGIANLAGALDAEDSAVLRWWIAATRERPVRFYIDARNRYAGVYGRPLPLQDLLDLRTFSAHPPAPALAPEVSASSEAMELSAPPPIVALYDELAREEQTQAEEADTSLASVEKSDAAHEANALVAAQSELELERSAIEPISADFSAELVAALVPPEAQEIALTPSPCIAIEASAVEAEPVASELANVASATEAEQSEALPIKATPTEAEVAARAHEPIKT